LNRSRRKQPPASLPAGAPNLVGVVLADNGYSEISIITNDDPSHSFIAAAQPHPLLPTASWCRCRFAVYQTDGCTSLAQLDEHQDVVKHRREVATGSP